MRNRYQRRWGKSKGKMQVIAGGELAVRLPLPLVEVWEELQAEVERLAGGGGVQVGGGPLGDGGGRGGGRRGAGSGRASARARAKRWHSRTTGASSKTGGCSGRWRNGWSAGCRRGSIVARSHRGWRGPATGRRMCWGYGREQRRTRRWRKPCWRIWWSAGWILSGAI